MNPKAFRYIHESITMAMMKAPPDIGAVAPSQLVVTMLSIAASMAQTFGVDFVSCAVSVIASADSDEARTMGMVRAAYAVNGKEKPS